MAPESSSCGPTAQPAGQECPQEPCPREGGEEDEAQPAGQECPQEPCPREGGEEDEAQPAGQECSEEPGPREGGEDDEAQPAGHQCSEESGPREGGEDDEALPAGQECSEEPGPREGGKDDEAQPAGQECSEELGQREGGEDDEAVWFLPVDWEVWWSEEFKCLTFHDSLLGDMRFEQDIADIAVKAHRSASISKARPLDLDKLRSTGALLGAKAHQSEVALDTPWESTGEASADVGTNASAEVVAAATGDAAMVPGAPAAVPAAAAGAEGGEAPEQRRRSELADADLPGVGTKADGTAPPAAGCTEGEDDEIWFLPDAWELYWDEGRGCRVFYDESGKMALRIEDTTAFKAKRSACVEEATPLDCVKLAGTVNLGAPAVHRATSSTAAPEPAEAEPEDGGVDYVVNTTKTLTVRSYPGQAKADGEQLNPEDDQIRLYDWDPSMRARRCRVPRLGRDFRWAGHTVLNVLRPAACGLDYWLPINPLILAVAENNLEFLRECIREGISVHGIQDAERTPLLIAAELGHADCCVILFHAGARDTLAAKVAPTFLLKALLLALEGGDENTPDFSMVDEQVNALQPEARELVNEMLEDIAARHAARQEKQRALAAAQAEEKKKAQYRDQHSTLLTLLDAEDEEESIHERMVTTSKQRQQVRRKNELVAEEEAKEQRERLEAQKLDERKRTLAEAKRVKEEAETAAVIARLQEAQRHFLASQQAAEEQKKHEAEEKKRRLREKMQAAVEARVQEEHEEASLHEERKRREEERERKAEERQQQLRAEAAEEELRKQQLEQMDTLISQQKGEAWTCMECGNDSVNHPDLPGSCMFCGTPRDQGHIAKTWEGWTWAGGVMVREE